MLIYSFASLTFTSEIRDLTFRLDDGKSSLDFKLSVGSTVLHEERYYTTGSFVDVRDIRSIIEQYMRSNSVTLATFYIEANGTTEAEFDVVYCSFASRQMSAEAFLQYNFLTTAKVKRIAPDGRDRLSFIGRYKDRATYYLFFTYTLGDSSQNFTTSKTYNANTTLQATELLEIEISIPQCISFLKSKYGDTVNLLSVTVKASDRSITYFIDKQQPDDVFFFRNIFNVIEMAQLHCVTTEKTKVSRSLAVCNGQASFYDQSTEKTYEVETSPLLLEEARWLEQMLHSHDVYHSPVGSAEAEDEIGCQSSILITDMTSEYQNGDSQLNTLKFTYRYADERPVIYFDEDPSVFDEPFTDPFA